MLLEEVGDVSEVTRIYAKKKRKKEEEDAFTFLSTSNAFVLIHDQILADFLRL